MSILKIIKYPNKILQTVSLPVDVIDEELLRLIENMFDTMYDSVGIGLAATQVGILKRVIIIDIPIEENNYPIVMINPEIIWLSSILSEYDEGCLSIPGVSSLVERPSQIKVSYLDILGNKQEILAEGLLAVCIQHEIDHLNGILFVDKLSKLKRSLLLKKYKKNQQKKDIDDKVE